MVSARSVPNHGGVLSPLLAALAFSMALGGLPGADNPPVKCNRATAGQYWPEAANTDRAVRARAMHCGTLRYCGWGIIRYRWQRVTVNYQELRRKKDPTAQACKADDPPPAASDPAAATSSLTQD